VESTPVLLEVPVEFFLKAIAAEAATTEDKTTPNRPERQ